jgi:hypothetical protein
MLKSEVVKAWLFSGVALFLFGVALHGPRHSGSGVHQRPVVGRVHQSDGVDPGQRGQDHFPWDDPGRHRRARASWPLPPALAAVWGCTILPRSSTPSLMPLSTLA